MYICIYIHIYIHMKGALIQKIYLIYRYPYFFVFVPQTTIIGTNTFIYKGSRAFRKV